MANFPEHWWKLRPLIFAHRGASLVAPENTLAAFNKAITAGADGIELDVRLTLDGVPVVLHNADVDKTTDGHGLVNDLPLDTLKNLDAGSWFDVKYSHEKIPTLEEVLDIIGNKTLINIELKAKQKNEANLAEKVCKLVRKMNLESHVWFSSFDASLLRQTRQYLPQVSNGYLYTINSPVSLYRIRTLPIEAVHPYFVSINQKYVDRMHKIDKRVAVWTVDDIHEAQKCSDYGVDVIITNDPVKLIQALHNTARS